LIKTRIAILYSFHEINDKQLLIIIALYRDAASRYQRYGFGGKGRMKFALVLKNRMDLIPRSRPIKITPVIAGMSSTPEIAKFMQNACKPVLDDLAKEISDGD
jgi:hypothetical protein